jgi:hypothetical protein
LQKPLFKTHPPGSNFVTLLPQQETRTRMANAESERVLKGRLEQHGDKAVKRPLHAGARVMAQFNGNPKLGWFPGVATLQNADGSWRIEYEDGDVEDLHVVPPRSNLPCIKHCDGAYVQSTSEAMAGRRSYDETVPEPSLRAV